MTMNNAALLAEIDSRLDHNLDNAAPTRSKPRRRVSSDPCLPERLPSIAFLQREADIIAPRVFWKRLRRSPSPSPPTSPAVEELEEELLSSPSPSEPESIRARRYSDVSSITSSVKSLFKVRSGLQSTATPWREPQPFEVFRAVEHHDIEYLMEVRDRAFPLLLRKSGDATPLLHAMRIGPSHRDVAIVLLGAFSRWINHLEDEELTKPKTKTLLKALRANLKLAIDFGLTKAQSDLTASFLQTLIMSEGDKWIWQQVNNVSLALRIGTSGHPVATANAAVRKFATKQLGKADLIATLEDYIANACTDLLMLAAWSLALELIPGERIPSYYFARDDRVYKAFVDRLDASKSIIQQSLSKRLKWQLRVLRAVLEGRNNTYHSKVEILIGELDEGEGV